ncbi:MAG: DUF6262 family protein [Rivularia sp. (in: cyanobacteria)]
MSKNHSRDKQTSVLRRTQAKRKEQKKEQVLKAIQEILKQKKPLTFKNIATVAGCSVSYLYKWNDIKAYIHELQQKGENTLNSLEEPRRADRPHSLKTLYQVTKDKIRKLEDEIKELKHQNEVLRGHVAQIYEIRDENERLRTKLRELTSHEGTVNIFQKQNEKLSSEIEILTQENVELKNKLARNTLKSKNKVTQIKRPTIHVSDSVKTELKKLKLKINSTLRKLIRENPEEVILESIDALKYAMLKNEIKNPSGFLFKAIKYRWKVPENISKDIETNIQQENEFPKGFEEWFLSAIDNGFILNESPFTLPKNTEGDLLVKVNCSSASGLPYNQMSWIEAKNLME